MILYVFVCSLYLISTGTKINGASMEEDAKGLILYLNKPKHKYELETELCSKLFELLA